MTTMDNPTDSASAATRGTRAGLAGLVSLVVAGLLAAACLAILAWGQLWLHQQHADDADATQSVNAAMPAVTSTLSYDYRHLAADRSRARRGLTGDALAEYDKVQSTLAKTAPRIKAVVTARVTAHSVLSADDSAARVLLFVDQTSTSTYVTKPELDESRVVVTLRHLGGRWLVSSLQAE